MQTEIITNSTIENGLAIFVVRGNNVHVIENSDGLVVLESPHNMPRNITLINDLLSSGIVKPKEGFWINLFDLQSSTQKTHRGFLLRNNSYALYDHRRYSDRQLAYAKA